MRFRRRPQRLLSLIVLGGITALHCIPQDEFQCEDAAQRLRSCCPQAGVHRCDYQQEHYTSGGGCSGQPLVHTTIYHEPELMGRHAACLANARCDDLRAAGVCAVSSWLLPETCTSRQDTLPGGAPEYFRTCTSPGQNGVCEGARSHEACEALRRLACH